MASGGSEKQSLALLRSAHKESRVPNSRREDHNENEVTSQSHFVNSKAIEIYKGGFDRLEVHSDHGLSMGSDQTQSEVGEDDDILELNFDEEEDVQDKYWSVLARFYSEHRCGSTGLFNEMQKAWLLRHQVVHKELHANLFQILDFYGEGDEA
jgi:hypothetical protein